MGINAKEAVVIMVRRQWNSWRSAAFDLDCIEGLHWDDTSGGVNAKAPRSFLHGCVWCNQKIRGDLDYSCQHGPGPHRIKVCVVKVDNKDVWPQILNAV